MSWLKYLVPGLGSIASAVASYKQAQKANEEAEAKNKERALIMRWSPWTGMRPGERTEKVSPGIAALGGGFSGLNAGMGLLNMINGLNTGSSGSTQTPVVQTGPFNPNQNFYGNYNFQTNPQLMGLENPYAMLMQQNGGL